MTETIVQLYEAIKDKTPEERRALFARLPEDKQKEIALLVRSQAVRELPVGLEGAKAYYYCRYLREIPKHTLPWVEAILWAYENGSGALIEAFRGATKSTVAENLICEYLFGKNPVKSGVILSATEGDANSMGKFVADAIEISSGWKMCFPNLVPDVPRGWGAENGYFIKNTDYQYDKWVDMQMADHQRDPSFLSSSVMAGTTGKHPTLYLFCDDMHTGKNTASPQEMVTLKKRFYSDAFPTLSNPTATPLFCSVFTPWDEEDTNAELKRANVYKYVRTPVLEFAENGNAEWEGEKCFLTWPDGFGMDKIKVKRKMNTASEFARMYLCDLVRAQNKLFKYSTFPHERIDPNWLCGGGVDYASIQKATRVQIANRSHFAYCLGTKTPYNTLVIKGGFVGQITQTEGEETVLRFQNSCANFRVCMIEDIGKGEEFVYLLMRNPSTKVNRHGVKHGSGKDDRIYKELSTLLENGMLLVSDEDTPFLNAVRRYFDRFPNIGEHELEKDVADSVYHMVAAFPEIHVMQSKPKEGLAQFNRPVITSSPWARIGA